MTEKKRHLTGSSNVITGEQLEKYPSTDLRNAFTGLATGLQITERNGSPGISAEEKNGSYRITDKVGLSARGRSLMYIIDDIPTDITEMQLDPQEIESATIIKDIAGKAMFGPLGADGIVYIKTKRGRTNERILNVNLEDGISIIDRMPEFVGGADYARLNNLARQNDGLTPNYTAEDISAYARNDPYDMYHPSINFTDMLLKNTMAFRRANISSSGGNDVVQYSSYLGYSGEGDIIKIGSVSDFNRISVRSNIDMKINDLIKVQFDISAGLTYRRSPNYGYATSESSGYTDLLELNYAIDNITATPPNAFPVYANNDPALKDPWFGGNSVYTINPIGSMTSNGKYTESGRRGAAKIALDYNMERIIPGLKSRTFFGFDALDLLRKGTAEDYTAYIVTPSVSSITGNDTLLLKKSKTGVDAPQLRNLHDYYYQRFTVYEKLSYEKAFGDHDFQSSLTYFLYRISKNGIEEPQRTTSAVWNLKYSFNDKYTIQGVLNYAGTYSFDKNNRFGLFPSIGASWIISEEDFMSGLEFIDFLKIRAQAGVLGYESFVSAFLYRDRWTQTTGNTFGPYTSGTKWFGTTSEATPYITYPSRIGNPDISWEKRKEFSIGLDALMFDEKLLFEVNYYNNLRDGQISQLPNTMPYIAGISTALPNFNHNQTRYFGVETGLQFKNTSGNFRYSVGGNANIQDSKYVKWDEPDYRFDYQYLKGKSTDTYWGQTFIGKFKSDAEALEVPQLFDAALKEGDLKYKDMNGDGLIDDNDRSAIGNTSPLLYYSLNVNLNYRNVELTVIGTGCAFFDIPLTSEYFWNGWGDNNYSTFVRDNIGGAYPRLTYYRVNNNFVASDFWLTRGDYFKIQNVELAYNFPVQLLKTFRSRGIRIFARGSNLLTVSKVKDIDPESTDSGIEVYPLFRTITGGIKLTF
jgi:TonB-linked SusC/RagA family outer membrane protein